MTLPYSDAIFVCAFPRECTEAFLEGHVRAFAFFGGVPRRISYDNSKIAVAKITGSRDRKLTDAFLRLKSHHLFEAHFCLVRRPNEKGHVETLDRLRPPQLPRAGPGGATAAWSRSTPASERRLPRRPRSDGSGASRRPRPSCSTRSGRPCCRCRREAFVAARVEQPGASTRCRWFASTPTSTRSRPRIAHHRVTAVGYGGHRPDRRRRPRGGRPTAAAGAASEVFYDPVHYLAVLERKPGALDFAAPLEGWELPVCFGVLAAAAGGRVRRAGDAAVHQGPAAAGVGRPATS